MTCTIYSRSGQALSQGRLCIQKEKNDRLRLIYKSNNGNEIAGGIIPEDGDLEAATDELFDAFFQAWGMVDLTMATTVKG
ncbi:MAG: hypothetical protein HC796_01525 [Synechococcaceae cyanobacterium RL_1_2]|nr:hypothetical protein [Synechococcaceae cyanobacterium RL_1_2]